MHSLSMMNIQLIVQLYQKILANAKSWYNFEVDMKINQHKKQFKHWQISYQSTITKTSC